MSLTFAIRVVDEGLAVVFPAAGNRPASPSCVGSRPVQHVEGRLAFSEAGSPQRTHVQEQAVALVHEDVAVEAGLGSLGRPLDHQPSVRIGGRVVGVTAPTLAVEVDIRIASITAAAWRSEDRSAEAVERGRRPQERPVDGEALRPDQSALFGLVHQSVEGLGSDLVGYEQVPVLAEAGRVEGRVFDPHAAAPLEEHVVLQALAGVAVGADRVEGGQERRAGQAIAGKSIVDAPSRL